MGVPSSGELSILKLAREKKYDDYNSTSSIAGSISLYDLFLGGNTKGSGESYEATNTLSPSYPKPINESQYLQGTDMPMTMSEWRSYDHNSGIQCSAFLALTVYKQSPDAPTCGTAKGGRTVYVSTSWNMTNVLLKDSGGGNCVNEIPGWYYYAGATQPGYEVRYWNGSSFTQNSGCA